MTFHFWTEDNSILVKEPGGAVGLIVSTANDYDFRQATTKLADLDGSQGYPLAEVSMIGRAFKDGHSQDVGRAAKKQGWDVRETPLAIDGGNLLTMNDAQGQTMALVGDYTLLANWMMLKDTKKIDFNAVIKVLQNGKYDKSLALELQYLYSRKGVLLSHVEVNRMAAEIQVVKDMIAGTLNLPPDKVVYVRQEDFHIDMKLRPVGPGKVMVNDLRQSLVFIDRALSELQAQQANGAPRESIAKEIKLLTRLRQTTEGLIKDDPADFDDQQEAALKAAGLKVHRAPLIFGYRSDVNFANGVAAIDKQGRRYLITNRSDSPVLNRLFAEDMKARLGMEVEWVSTGGLLVMLGGFDCITQEKKLKKDAAKKF